MKTRINNALVLLFAILLVACNSIVTASPTQPVEAITSSPELVNPITPTPEVFNPLNPSPTPSGSDLPLTCQVTDLTVFVDRAAGYCYAYPQRFSMADFPMLGVQAVQGPPVETTPDAVAATFAVIVSPFDPNKSLDQQVDSFLKEFTAVAQESLPRSRITVAGEEAVSVDMVPTQLSWRLVFVAHNGQLYRLMYWPVDVAKAQSDLEELYQTTVNSFAFLSPGTTNSANPTPVVQAQTKEGLAVSYGSLNLVLPPGLASGASGSQLPRVDELTAPWYELTPAYTQLTLDGYLLQGKSRQPRVLVFPANDYAELNAVAAESMRRLQPIISNPQLPVAADQLPAVPFFNEVQVFAASVQVLSFESGSGVRFLTQYAQSAPPANNADLFYQFQGLTSDGAYYIVAILPISAPGLGETSDPASAVPINGVAYPTMGDPNADWKGYYGAVTNLLDTIAPKAFSPTLAQLDVLIQSIQIISGQ